MNAAGIQKNICETGLASEIKSLQSVFHTFPDSKYFLQGRETGLFLENRKGACIMELKIGLVGTGGIGRTHIERINHFISHPISYRMEAAIPTAPHPSHIHFLL